jgi:phosphoribosylanthranilate isomerase
MKRTDGPRVKICGCMKVADAVAAADAGADFIGIMFAVESRRRVAVEEAVLIASAVGSAMAEIDEDDPPPLHPGRFVSSAEWFSHGAEALDRLLARKRPLVVGVFKDQPIAEINEIADEVDLDLVQLSGSEPWSDCALLTRQAINVIRPIPGMTAGDIIAMIEPDSAIAVMLDPSSGRGATGDWDVAARVASQLPLWLAGGLTPDTVAEAIRIVRPWAVDVSTFVETDGAKDPAKIAAFVRAAKSVAVR